MTARACRAGAWLGLAGLCVAVPAGAGGSMSSGGSGTGPGPWVGETVLSSEERREFEARRAAVAARADDLAARVGACGHLRALVREGLSGVQHVRAVEVGLVLLTANPPRMPVALAVALTSGRVIWDRLVVTVPVRPRLVPLGEPAEGRGAPPRDPRPG